MVTLGIAVIFSLTLCLLAYKANARFRNERRLPMQWWLTGEVTWSAPRRLALAFIPILGIGALIAFVIMSAALRPRAGQEVAVLPTLIGVGMVFIAVQLAHFWLIARTLRRNSG